MGNPVSGWRRCIARSPLIPAVVVVAVHVWLTVSQRFLGYNGYADCMIYHGPALPALVALPAGSATGDLIDGVMHH